MKKKELKKLEVEYKEAMKEVEVKVEPGPQKPNLGKLDLTFNQEDLNRLKDKVNEIVDRLN